MRGPLRVLVAEDSANDHELLELELERSGFDVTTLRVETAEAMTAALDREPWDLVVSDWAMPAFSALGAIAVVKAKAIDLPIIIASGTVDDETAVEAMRAGAHDFMAKDNLARLVPAIERELREVEVRRERARMHEHLLISDRMASMGTLAAGVAHEINNPLAALVMNLELMARDLGALAARTAEPALVGALDEQLADARVAADRIRDIVQDVKLFSRAGDDTRTRVDVHDVLASSLRMAWNEIRHRAELIEQYGPVGPVLANPSRLGQVFLNLIVNAAQAIPLGRRDHHAIRITTSTDPLGRVVVAIADTGAGMAPDVVRKLFTPFFTTKPIGVGTGLGLSICHRIVSELGGEITVESTPGAGSTFRVLLPPASAAGDAIAPARGADGGAGAAASSPRGRVLVVDDDAMVGRAVARALQDDHDVAVTTHGQDVLGRLAAGQRFDVILCDLMMPEMSGMALYAAVRAQVPAQAERMVFVTGGAFTEEARSFLDQIDRPPVEKPFDMRTLATLIARMVTT